MRQPSPGDDDVQEHGAQASSNPQIVLPGGLVGNDDTKEKPFISLDPEQGQTLKPIRLRGSFACSSTVSRGKSSASLPPLPRRRYDVDEDEMLEPIVLIEDGGRAEEKEILNANGKTNKANAACPATKKWGEETRIEAKSRSISPATYSLLYRDTAAGRDDAFANEPSSVLDPRVAKRRHIDEQDECFTPSRHHVQLQQQHPVSCRSCEDDLNPANSDIDAVVSVKQALSMNNTKVPKRNVHHSSQSTSGGQDDHHLSSSSICRHTTTTGDGARNTGRMKDILSQAKQTMMLRQPQTHPGRGEDD